MNPRRRLGRQIVWSMGLVSVITTLIAFVGSYLIYGLLFTYLPQLQQPEDSWVPRTPDYLIFAGTLLVALVAAIVIALRLARRILAPLNSLAESARAPSRPATWPRAPSPAIARSARPPTWWTTSTRWPASCRPWRPTWRNGTPRSRTSCAPR